MTIETEKFLVAGKRQRMKKRLGRMTAVSSRLRLPDMIGSRSTSGASLEQVELMCRQSEGVVVKCSWRLNEWSR